MRQCRYPHDFYSSGTIRQQNQKVSFASSLALSRNPFVLTFTDQQAALKVYFPCQVMTSMTVLHCNFSNHKPEIDRDALIAFVFQTNSSQPGSRALPDEIGNEVDKSDN